jgi:hypothetical protein
LAAVSLLNIEIRDAMVAWLCPGTHDLDELGEEVQKPFSGLESARTSTLPQQGLRMPSRSV